MGSGISKAEIEYLERMHKQHTYVRACKDLAYYTQKEKTVCSLTEYDYGRKYNAQVIAKKLGATVRK